MKNVHKRLLERKEPEQAPSRALGHETLHSKSSTSTSPSTLAHGAITSEAPGPQVTLDTALGKVTLPLAALTSAQATRESSTTVPTQEISPASSLKATSLQTGGIPTQQPLMLQQKNPAPRTDSPHPAVEDGFSLSLPQPSTPIAALNAHLKIAFRQRLKLKTNTRTDIYSELNESKRFTAADLKMLHAQMMQTNLLSNKWKSKEKALEEIAYALVGTFGSISQTPSSQITNTTLAFIRLQRIALSDLLRPILTASRKEWKTSVLPVATTGYILSMLFLLGCQRNPFKKVKTFFTLSPSDLDHLSKCEVIYALLSVKSDQFYVGRTDNIHRRIREHYNAALKGDPKKLYTHMRAVGIHHFFLFRCMSLILY